MARRPDFGNANLWEVHKDINVFAEHHRQLRREDPETGEVEEKKIVYDRKRLEKIAANTNRRDRANQPCPLVLGHTREDEYDAEGNLTYKATEEEQPDIVGYARNHRVVYDRDLGKWVVRADYYLHKNEAARARKFPRTSVEVWEKGDFFDPIALLKRTPRLDLGQWTYARGGDVKLRYSMDDILHDEPDGDEVPGRDDAPPPPDEGDDGRMPPEDDLGPEDVDPDFHANFSKCMKHYEKKAKGKNAMGDGGSDTLPVSGRAKKPAPPPRDDDRPGRNRRTPEDIRFEKLEKAIYSLRSEVRSVQAERDDLVTRNARSEAREELREALAGKTYDLEEEVDIYMLLPEEKREARLRYLKATLADDPTHGGDVRLKNDRPRMSRSGTKGRDTVRVSGGSESGRVSVEFDDDQLEKANAYMRANPGCDWEQAEQYARGERAITGELVGRNGR